MAEPKSDAVANDDPTPSPAWSEIWLGGGMLAFALILAWWLIPGYIADYSTGDQGLSPRFFPYLITIIIGLLSALLIARNIRPQDLGRAEQRLDGSTFLCIGLFIVYQQSISFIGLAPASFFALAALMFLYGFRNWLIIAFFSLITVVCLSLFFELVALVPLPRGSLLDGFY